MLPPAIVEQQAKLGVSAEDSKVQRLKRQQARFRDRGGAFVPSTSNPLIDILLARTVSGESPSKAPPKGLSAKRRSPVKARQTSSRKANAAITSSKRSVKSKPTVAQKRKTKGPVLEDGTDRKQRSDRQAKGKGKVLPDTDIGTEKSPSNAKFRSTLKGKGKQRDTIDAQSSSGGTAKPKSKLRTKSNPARTATEVLVSDDDRPLVEARPKINSTGNKRYTGEDETNAEAVIVRKAEERLTLHGDNSNSAIAHIDDEKRQAFTKPMGDERGKSKVKSNQDTTETVKGGDRPPERTSKAQKRKKEDNQNDRPRKAVKFSDTAPSHPSSRCLKENQSDKMYDTDTKPRVKDSNAPRPKLTAKPLSRAKGSKGPPREVLERIKASAERHLQCADNDSDELDCLS